jgi:hypothetical protein
MKTKNTVTCPECKSEIDVNQILYHQLEEQIKNDYATKSKQKEKEIDEQRQAIDIEKQELVQYKQRINGLIADQVKEGIKTEKINLEKQLREKIMEESSDQMKDMQKELLEKSVQVRELNKTKGEVEKLKREKDELRDAIALEKEREFSEKLKEEKLKLKKQADEENFLKIKELERQLEVQKDLAIEAVRKAEQGSMQSQGEIQEITLEKMLRDYYIYDEVTEIKKGQKGADSLQHVKTLMGVTAGKIYYESKRTKHFDYGWIKKLKQDNQSIKADILVIVTQTMPVEQESFFYCDGVWVCNLWETKGLSMVLRHSLLQMHAVAVTNQGKEGKMELLYSYLTSREFAAQFGAILEGFKSLQDNFCDEKLKMQKLWKVREKELEKILSNAVDFYGSIRGIGGESIVEIQMLKEAPKIFVEK